MKLRLTTMFAALAVLAVTLLFHASIASAGGSAPVHITFHKCVDTNTGTWEGEVGGDFGPGHVSYVDLPPFFGKKVQHFSGEYTVTTGEGTFKAEVSGQWNSRTGQIVLNGVVTEGPQAGGQFHVHAEWDGGACSRGEMTITSTH